MRRVFIDTSAVLAFLSAEDDNHSAAEEAFERLAAERAALVTSSYVLVETYALVSRRLGVDAARAVREKFEPLLHIIWVDSSLHGRALEQWLGRGRRKLSLVDCVSFLVVEDEQLDAALAFDSDFVTAGIAAPYRR